jgi:hypothetical protein
MRRATRWTSPWEFADPETTRRRLEAAGFAAIAASLEPAPTPFADRQAFTRFVTTVVVRPHLACLPDEGLRKAFVEAVADATPDLTLDYVRLNIEARKP